MDQSRRNRQSFAAGAAPRRPRSTDAQRISTPAAASPAKTQAQGPKSASVSHLSSEAERARKVARIRRALKTGRYHVSASDLAGKLIENMLKK